MVKQPHIPFIWPDNDDPIKKLANPADCIPMTKFSPDRQHRYTLQRIWKKAGKACMFIGLNPSTADEIQNDPTVTRCINYAKNWGYGRLIMTNIFAYRQTDPKEMKKAPDPIGPDNDHWLKQVALASEIVICAWGTHGIYRDRHSQVLDLLSFRPLHCLKITKGGYPYHPLYLKSDLKPVLYRNSGEEVYHA